MSRRMESFTVCVPALYEIDSAFPKERVLSLQTPDPYRDADWKTALLEAAPLRPFTTGSCSCQVMQSGSNHCDLPPPLWCANSADHT